MTPAVYSDINTNRPDLFCTSELAVFSVSHTSCFSSRREACPSSLQLWRIPWKSSGRTSMYVCWAQQHHPSPLKLLSESSRSLKPSSTSPVAPTGRSQVRSVSKSRINLSAFRCYVSLCKRTDLKRELIFPLTLHTLSKGHELYYKSAVCFLLPQDNAALYRHLVALLRVCLMRKCILPDDIYELQG